MDTDAKQQGLVQKVPKSLKVRLAARFKDWPLLRLLILSFWFRTVVLGMLGGVALVAIVLPKVWVTTPPGPSPEVKVSLLDKVQAWSLKKRATTAESNGDSKTALDAWRAAWANNYADLESIRGLLRVVPKQEQPERSYWLANQAGLVWLYRNLQQTNELDVALIARALVNAGLADRAAILIASGGTNSIRQLERLYLIALLQDGRTNEFAQRMAISPTVQPDIAAARQAALEYVAVQGTNAAAAQSSNDDPADPSSPGTSTTVVEGVVDRGGPGGLEEHFDLFCLAYLYGWGKDDVRGPALAKLRSARDKSDTKALAFDLELRGKLQLRDVTGYGATLEESEAVADRRNEIRHQTDYWWLLASTRDTNEIAKAISLVDRKVLLPATVPDAQRLASVYNLMDRLERTFLGRSEGRLVQKAIDTLKATVSTYGPNASLGVALLCGQLLAENKQWKELRSLAATFSRRPYEERYGGYGKYLAGVAELEPNMTNGGWAGTWTGDQVTFRSALSNALEIGFPEQPALALVIAQNLAQLSEGALKRPGNVAFGEEINKHVYQLVTTNREALSYSAQSRLVAAQLLMKTAVQLKLSDGLLEAARTLHELQPKDPGAANNYAAALIVDRQETNTTEAIQLTQAVLQASDALSKRGVDTRALKKNAVLNHFSALVLNRRYEDAEKIFAPLTPAELETASPADAAQYHLGMFEIYWKTGRLEDARRELKIIRRPEIWAELYRPAQVDWLEAAANALDSNVPSGK